MSRHLETYPVIDLTPSYGVSAFIACVYLGGLICLWSVQLSMALKIIISIAAIIAAVVSILRYGLLSTRGSIVRFQKQADNWMLTLSGASQIEAQLDKRFFRTHFFTLLIFTSGKRTITVPVARDAVNDTSYRRLMRYLTVRAVGEVEK